MSIILFAVPIVAFLAIFAPAILWHLQNVQAYNELSTSEERRAFKGATFPVVKTAGLVALWILIAFIANGFTVVDYGTTAVITRFGEVTDRILGPGAHIRIPFVEGVVTYNTQKVTYETSNNQEASEANYKDFPVDTTTNDGQQVAVRYTIRFSVDPTQVQWIANNIGTEQNLVEKVVKTESRVYVRNIVRNYTAEQLYTGNILEAQDDIRAAIEPTFSENGLVLDTFGIRQVEFQPEYVDAVEQKQIQKEKVEAEKHIAEQEKFKKEAAITKAEGEAKAQELQRQTLSDELLFKLWIEKWNGELPQYMLGDSGTLIQLPQQTQ